jgi:hypothetical protein
MRMEGGLAKTRPPILSGLESTSKNATRHLLREDDLLLKNGPPCLCVGQSDIHRVIEAGGSALLILNGHNLARHDQCVSLSSSGLRCRGLVVLSTAPQLATALDKAVGPPPSPLDIHAYGHHSAGPVDEGFADAGVHDVFGGREILAHPARVIDEITNAEYHGGSILSVVSRDDPGLVDCIDDHFAKAVPLLGSKGFG